MSGVSQGVKAALAALRRDLVHDDGPRISTMRNYRFAIVPYAPDEELGLRAEVQRLSSYLIERGWVVLSISLQELVLARLRAQGEEWRDRIIAMEKQLATPSASRPDRGRALQYLKDKITPIVEGEGGMNGIAEDCGTLIRDFAAEHPDKADRTLAMIGRAGALYPFFRSSALLKHLDGRTSNVPVVLLYPGTRRGNSALSFMGMIEPDSDYRPRIYP